jgi:hypothetical protein
MKRHTAVAAVLLALAAGCSSSPEPVAPAGTVNPRCGELSWQIVQAYDRGDTEAQKTLEQEFDRLAEAGECDARP